MSHGCARDRGYQETGGGTFDLVVSSDERILVDLHPRLRIGTEYRNNDGVLIRPFFEAGMRFALNDEELEQRFVSGALSGEALKMAINREDTPATVGLGLQASHEEVTLTLSDHCRQSGPFARQKHPGNLAISVLARYM